MGLSNKEQQRKMYRTMVDRILNDLSTKKCPVYETPTADHFAGEPKVAEYEQWVRYMASNLKAYMKELDKQ